MDQNYVAFDLYDELIAEHLTDLLMILSGEI